MTEPRPVWTGDALLGEGPAWDPVRGVLWFVDIKARRLHCYDPARGTAAAWDAPAAIGWAVPARDARLLCGVQGALLAFDPVAGSFEQIAGVEPNLPGNRLNDATVGPDGTVWFGTMDDAEAASTGRFYRWNGSAVNALPIPPVVVTNGPCMSPDGRTLYHVDTAGGSIHAATLDAAGRTGASRVFATIDPADGYPDGVIADAAGNIWVGLWGGWRARLYAPDGAILREVRFPVANVTKVALGGGDLRTAYVTTASIGLDDAARAAQPLAGALFTFDADVPGLPLPLARIGATPGSPDRGAAAGDQSGAAAAADGRAPHSA